MSKTVNIDPSKLHIVSNNSYNDGINLKFMSSISIDEIIHL